MAKDIHLTSVEIVQPLFDKFKMACLQDKFSFKKLADRAIFLYITDKAFRDKLNKQHNITIDE